MREAFGGTFMIKLVLIFIIIYIAFMAIAVNYAKVFRVKNGVINLLEQNQYSGDGSLTVEVDNYLASSAYLIQDTEKLVTACRNSGDDAEFFERGVCVQPKGTEEDRYYKVTVYIEIMQFPFLNLKLTLPISGETETMGEWRKVSE